MAATVTHSMVQQFASMKPAEFAPTIDPKWQVGERLLKEVKLCRSRRATSHRSTAHA